MEGLLEIILIDKNFGNWMNMQEMLGRWFWEKRDALLPKRGIGGIAALLRYR